MNYNEVESILSNILERETEVLDKPTDKEWKELSDKFNCSFSNEFKYFIELMTFWSFPGDIYNVSKGKTNGNDTLEEVYNYEMSNGNWNSNMLPFYGIGNGDYFCLHRLESKVYYYYDDKGEFKEYCDIFKAWIEDLPNFLA
ncbi:SMI1/KNR4 family protein (plasmid) [Bacillus mycoides]|uniref:SMI1/KNR4 family protein n=1 Tax=Bacillus mycoides TaxID=1405 RepID=UPI001C034852|nr:SMI1/KNR4 family protein [Bacillus mycoides]MDI6533858.1 SMI1/KNR4 family protein [Bacillus mycoides]QWI41370.1 SMI1/KNR4 family protein [Bacillus mycoides]WJE61345.1 SMI1/KNR4 family protein [Bacillus mycoides]WJE67579.1 SMI1/KNR4 family protein [Bacillus mycoides]